MNHVDQHYLTLLSDLLSFGQRRDTRSGPVLGLFGRQMRFDIGARLPLLTTKRVHFKSVVLELLWFLRGDTNVRWLQEQGVTIWDEWADDCGELGPVYGRQWRSWPTPDDRIIDQIGNVVRGLRDDPFGRRHVVSAWNPAELELMALPPCHCLFQFYVREESHGVRRLDCQLYQRSADAFLGVPFNIASYALLTKMIAHVVGMKPGEFVHTLGDYHLYVSHIAQARQQIRRAPRPLPAVKLFGPTDTIDGWSRGDFELVGYDPHPRLPAPVAA